MNAYLVMPQKNLNAITFNQCRSWERDQKSWTSYPLNFYILSCVYSFHCHVPNL